MSTTPPVINNEIEALPGLNAEIPVAGHLCIEDDPNAGPALTAEQFLIYLQQHAHSNGAVYNFLFDGVSESYYKTLKKRIELVEAAERPANGGYSIASWRSRQNDIKARLFEQLVGLFLKACKPFSSYNRIITPTNEIDWLVVFGPLQSSVPSFRDYWGAHFICECKFTQQNVKSEWVGKLNTLLQTHGGRVAVLISQKTIDGARGKAAEAKRLAQDLSIMEPPRYILSLSFSDLDLCVDGGVNFIELLHLRFTELRTRLNNRKLLLA